MISKIKKPVSILLVFMMIVSLFAIVPITASAEVGEFVSESDYLTFTAVEAGSSVTLKYTGGTLQYNENNSGWQSYTAGTQIALSNAGDSVRFCGKNTTFNRSNHVSIVGKVACSGNVMSLRLDDDGRDQGLSDSCFSYMFYGCTGLTAAPELPETTLANYCYSNMFYGCTSLTTAPELPATTLAENCYYNMFSRCGSLTTAPELPATSLARYCYSNMFARCANLTTAPELPATTLAENCYYNMFSGCENLTEAPELPATTLEYSCYSYMFNGCTRLTTAPELPATTLAPYCYTAMFAGCSSIKLSETQTDEYSIPYSVPSGGDGTTASSALYYMFDGTGGTFTGTPEINKTYYRPAKKYTVTWLNDDGTTIDTTSVYEGDAPTHADPTKAADGDHMYVFSGWTPEITAVTGDVTYTAQYTATAKTFKVYVNKLTGGTYTIENLTGGTTVAQLKEIIADQIDIPATAQRLIFAGKNLEDAKTLAEYNIQKESTIHLVLRGYTVTWLNYDNSELGTKTVQYGATPSYDGETPTKPEDEQNTYTFAGWKNGNTTYGLSDTLPAVSGDVTYTAQFDATKKPISSTDLYEGLVLDKDNTIKFIIVKSGENWRRIDLSVYLDGTLVKELYTQDVSTTEPDRYYTTTKKCIVDSYEFSYGDPVRHVLYLKSVYDVTWKNDDGTELEKDENVVVGTTPTYNGTAPEKAEDANYTYTFADWSDGTNTYAANAIPAVTADVTYTAQYTATFKGITSNDLYEGRVIDAGTPIKFMIIKSGQGWRRVDLSVYLDGTLVKELVTQDVSQTEPDRYYTTTKKCIVYSYESSNGDPTRHVLYLKSVYDVTWKNDDGTELEKDENVVVGTTPTYDGATPYKADGADCIYTFSGWTPEVSAVTGDATYTAQFTESEKPETIKDCNNKYGNFRLYSNVPIVSFSNVNDLLTGAIIPITYGDSNTMIPVQDAKGYSYKFYDQTGTEIPAQIADSSSAPGSNYEFSDDVTVYTNVINFTRPADCTAIYIVATEHAPAPAKLILHVGENGKVVMDNGTFGNATDASNITETSAPVNVADGSKIFIVDGHTANLLEGGSINIATGGELSFYPSADNTGVITAIPDEGYVFVGWYNGNTLYSSGAALAYQNISEDITLTAKFERELFWKHSVSLGGDIGVNFYLNPAVLDTYTGAKTVTFSWDGNETTVDVPTTATADGYKVTCNVVAAQMAHKIHAVVKADGTALAQTDDYSVQDYAETVYANPAAYDSEKPEQLKALAKALLNYGAMAQTVFYNSLKEHPALANTTVGDNGYAAVTAEQIGAAIKGESADLNAVAAQLGAKYYTSSLIYLSKNTLRVYFTPTTYPGTIPNADKYAGNLSDYYYYVDHANIPAAELDEQKELTVGDYTFTYTALDYAKAVVESTKMEPEQKNLAKALYLYNQKANAYFDAAPAPVQKIVDLSTLTGNYEAQNNDVLTGVLSGDKQITIADGATVTLKNADISQDFSADSAGITLLGNATILLEGTNTVMGGFGDRPGIYVPANTTLTIDGDGSLTASGQENGCGIGGGYGYDIAAGNIVINGGTITATGGEFAAGIGSGNISSCGNITINGGTITANGGEKSAGIGSGYGATCGNIMIADTVTQVTATKGSDAPNSIGAGQYASCGTKTIAPGANVIQN